MKKLLGVAAVTLVLLLQASPAVAHARYESSTPDEDETVSSPPSEVQVNFTEAVESDSYLEVTDACGAVVSGDSRVLADTITVSMSGTHAGTYTVYYRLQSIDSHVTDGSFTFSSSGGDPCPGEEPPTTKSGGGGNVGDDPAGPGGGSGGDDPSSGGGGDTSVDTTDTSSDVSSGGGSGDTQASGGGNGKGQGGGNNKDGSGSNGGGGEVELALENENERRGPDPWDLPRDGLIAGLVIAALIGAAGGRIYASIVGPRT